ncbi:DUF2061 domain-containing protein [Tepidibacter aestuarii]|uniref:DUF2061 domain-containing protein n=1 Tax=Tepidibacter aestuarii TaxID=2925782 RepID=UPI0020BEF403|nr:DUF2061 domain-containing protein [Tepidibacter aestuarii]CAH2214600.1 DUF2061 domain-containing protein [Tepidibacter aestuarii]
MTGKRKSFLKTITWRFTATLTTLILVYLLSGELKVAGTVAFFEVFIKMLLYYLHERMWEKVKVKEIVEHYI